jgi:choline dehydrogenase-like flavoprotein
MSRSRGECGRAGQTCPIMCQPAALEKPDVPGTSLHETRTCRMGNDSKKFVTNRFGQTHDVPNLYIADASLFPNCTDKTTTISILAFSLRASEHLIEIFKRT